MSLDGGPENAPPAGPAHTALDALIDMIADRVVGKLASLVGAGNPRYADGRNNPLGSRRAFLDAASRGDFATFKRSKRITALWADVERYIESRRCERPAARQEAIDPERAELEAAGVRFRPDKGARG